MIEDNDKKLVNQYLEGDEKALEILISQYLKPIYGFVYRYVANRSDAEDITQETFVRMWRNLKKFDRQKNFKTWIFTIAKNAAIDFFRKKKAIPFSEFNNEKGENVILDTLEDPAFLPDEILERKDTSNLITSAVEKLSSSNQLLISLRYNNQFTFREIAEFLGEPINTVKSRSRRAVMVLKKLLKP